MRTAFWLTVGATVVTLGTAWLSGCAQAENPKVVGNDPQGQQEQHQEAGRDVKNITIQLVGDTTTPIIAAGIVGGIMLVIFWPMIKRRSKALSACIEGLEATGTRSGPKVTACQASRELGVQQFLDDRVQKEVKRGRRPHC
ncbi:MAG: hypothetical protein GX616_24885 [Planctomycetes bacterium]|nr:hypothetical protein [Planctomycetota bacterium]